MISLILLMATIEIFLYIVLPIVGTFIVLFVVLIIVKSARKKAFLKERERANAEIVEYIGGRDNVISASSSGSRLILVLKDYSLVNDEKIKSLGVSSIIRMSTKITFVIGEDAKNIAELFNR